MVAVPLNLLMFLLLIGLLLIGKSQATAQYYKDINRRRK